MSLEILTQFLTSYAQKSENLDIISEQPLVIEKISEELSDTTLILRLEESSQELDKKSIRLSLSTIGNQELKHLSERLLRIKQEPRIHFESAEVPALIDENGFTTYLNFTGDNTPIDEAEIGSMITKLESVIIQLIKGTAGALSDSEPDTAESNQNPKTTQTGSAPEVIEHYFTGKEYKFRHDTVKKRFITGFGAEKYVDPDGDSQIMILIDYSDADLVRFRTPRLYIFDLDRTPYALLASVIAWYQFQYKFLSMSLDPSDGECVISIDVPIKGAQLFESQIERLLGFIRQFVDDTYQEFFAKLADQGEAVEAIEESINKKLGEHKGKVEQALWLQKQTEKLETLDEAQREEVSKFIDNISSKGGI